MGPMLAHFPHHPILVPTILAYSLLLQSTELANEAFIIYRWHVAEFVSRGTTLSTDKHLLVYIV